MVHQNVVFESRPGLEPLGVETFVFVIVTALPETESTGATLVMVPFDFWLKLPGQEGVVYGLPFTFA